MAKTARFVQGVQGLCRHLCRGFRSCAWCAGSTRHTCARRRTTPNHHTPRFANLYPCTPCTPCTSFLNQPLTKKVMVHNPLHTMHTPKPPETTTRVIRCTAENEGEFRTLLAEWPELRAYVKGLHADGLLPGLRAMSITLTGTPAAVAGGVGALRAARASMGPENKTKEPPCKSA